MVNRLVPYIKIAKRDKLIARRSDAADDVEYFTAEEVDDLLGNVVSYHIEPDKCQACMI